MADDDIFGADNAARPPSIKGPRGSKRRAPAAPIHRILLAWGLIIAGLPFMVLGLLESNPSGRMDFMLPGVMLIALGVAARFHHLRF